MNLRKNIGMNEPNDIAGNPQNDSLNRDSTLRHAAWDRRKTITPPQNQELRPPNMSSTLSTKSPFNVPQTCV